jgi:uncharacterized protein YecE (DUF72 family)
MTERVRVGCSGWQYRHWRGVFYPKDLPVDAWLDFYVDRFDTVELNNSFYRLPDAETFAAWHRRLPRGFVMAVKASRYLTHLKRLRDPEQPLDRFWSRAERLRAHLGPVLYQLPPRWNRNVERLAAFVDAAPRRRRQAFEFRDRSWYRAEVYDLLDRAGATLCLHDMPGSASRNQAVGPFVYVRFHGSGSRYGGRYPSQRLAAWADRLAEWARDGRPAYVYFNNDVGGHAVRDAERLRRLLERRGVT